MNIKGERGEEINWEKRIDIYTLLIPLVPWKKSMTNLDSIFKIRDITLSTKVHIVIAMVFPVVMSQSEKNESESCLVVSDSLRPHEL